MSEQTESAHEPVDHPSYEEGEDTLVDALAAVALIGIFAFTCLYWIASQG